MVILMVTLVRLPTGRVGLSNAVGPGSYLAFV